MILKAEVSIEPSSCLQGTRPKAGRGSCRVSNEGRVPASCLCKTRAILSTLAEHKLSRYAAVSEQRTAAPPTGAGQSHAA